MKTATSFSFALSFLIAVPTFANPEPSADDPQYAGRVPARYFNSGMMKDKERDLTRALANAQDNCGQTFEVDINWASYDGDWTNTWNPLGFVGFCTQFLRALSGACYDGHRSGVRGVTKIQCYYEEDLPVADDEGSLTYYKPALRKADHTIHVGYRYAMFYSRTLMREFLTASKPARASSPVASAPANSPKATKKKNRRSTKRARRSRRR